MRPLPAPAEPLSNFAQKIFARTPTTTCASRGDHLHPPGRNVVLMDHAGKPRSFTQSATRPRTIENDKTNPSAMSDLTPQTLAARKIRDKLGDSPNRHVHAFIHRRTIRTSGRDHGAAARSR